MEHNRVVELREKADFLLTNTTIFIRDLGFELRECLDEIEKYQSYSKVLVIRKRLEACLSDVCPIRGYGKTKCPVFRTQQANQYTTPCYRYPDCFKIRIAYCKGEIDAPKNIL